MGLLTQLLTEPLAFILSVVPLLYSIIAHEVAHGWVAYLFGDDTAKNSGRLSLKPLPHLDPAGTLMLFVVGFGWAKPVPVNFRKLRNFRLGLISVSFAGCLVNILIATAAVFLLQFRPLAANAYTAAVLINLVRVNIILGAFNLIPIPPLDGSKVLMGFLPQQAQLMLARLEPYGLGIVLLLLFTGVLNPVIAFMIRLISLVITILLGILT